MLSFDTPKQRKEMAETQEIERILREAEQKAREAREDLVKDTPTFFRRVWNKIKKVGSSFKSWFNRPIKVSDVIIFTLVVILLLGLTVNKEKSTFNVTVNKTEAVEKTIPPVKKDVRYASAISVNDNIVTIDLSKMKVTKTAATTNLKNKQKMIGVSYALEMGMKDRKGSSIYLTVYEDEDSLNLTKGYTDLLKETK